MTVTQLPPTTHHNGRLRWHQQFNLTYPVFCMNHLDEGWKWEEMTLLKAHKIADKNIASNSCLHNNYLEKCMIMIIFWMIHDISIFVCDRVFWKIIYFSQKLVQDKVFWFFYPPKVCSPLPPNDRMVKFLYGCKSVYWYQSFDI